MSRNLARSYAALWTATAIGAMAAVLGLRLLAAAAPYDALTPAPSTAVALLCVNAVVALWPLGLLWLGWDRLPLAAQVADVLIRAQIFGNGLIAGNALGQHPRLALYLPHLPLEWLAIAMPVAAWQSTRLGERTALLRATAATFAALAAAALVETYLVPVA